MKLIAQVKLVPSVEQAQALKETLVLANAACNWISAHAWEKKVFGQYSLHKEVYHQVKGQFGLTAQAVVCCLAKVADAYKVDKKRLRQFKRHSAIAYDDRILRWYVDKGEVSIWAVGGRQRIPFVCGDRQRKLLASQQGESDLVYCDGNFYLLATCNAVDPTPRETKDFLGVDLGISNIATDSEGEKFSGSKIKALRRRHAELRAKLQAKGTKSAKRLLKQRKRTESRFARDVNHCISKKLVSKAQGTGRSLALENLKGIRERLVVRKAQRRIQHSWSFNQLRLFVEYKARLAGVVVVLVNPRNTSRTCPSCGYCDKANRPTRDLFRCGQCNLSGCADTIAAVNIGRAAVNRPYAEAAG
jgi:IS605 OrfB family transposase